MKKFALVIAIVVSLGLVGSLFASPASAFFFGGFGKKSCGSGYGMGYGYGGCAPMSCAPAYCAPMYCGPAYCPPPCAPMCGGKVMKKGKKAKSKKMK